MRPTLLATACAVLCGLATPALADDAAATAPPSDFTITGAAAIVSQYRFRGISQSNNRPVVQGTFTVAHKSGFYLSTWGSSANQDNSGIVTIGGTEIDVYGGYTHAIGKTGLTVDAGVYGYIYPGGTPNNYYEVYGSLAYTYGPVTAKVGTYIAPSQNVFDIAQSALPYHITHHNVYVYGELSSGIGKSPFSVHAHLGHTGGGFDYLFGTKPYLDYVAGVSYKWKALTFDISAVGTNVSRSRSNAFSTAIGGAPTGNQFYRLGKFVPVGSVTASF